MKIATYKFLENQIEVNFKYEPWEQNIINWSKDESFYEPQIYEYSGAEREEVYLKLIKSQMTGKFLKVLSEYVSFISLRLTALDEECRRTEKYQPKQNFGYQPTDNVIKTPNPPKKRKQCCEK